MNSIVKLIGSFGNYKTNGEKADPWSQVIRLVVMLALASPAVAAAQVYTVLRNFTGSDGQFPFGGVVLAGSTLYGTVQSGGGQGCSDVFKINTDGSGFTLLKSFALLQGGCPYPDLAVGDNTLYGTTTETADIGGYGAVFKLSTDGSGFAVLMTFTDPTGGFESLEQVILGGGVLYGTSAGGGSFGHVFKLNTDGSGYTVLKSFSGGDGSGPEAALVLEGSTLYGTTSYGGSFDAGVVFKVNTDGSGFTVLKHFNGSDAQGPGMLVLTNGTLFGIAGGGGSSGDGVIFRLNTDGSGFTVLKSFSGSDGGNPHSLVLSGSRLYGTAYGGAFGVGVIFAVNTDGSNYEVLKNFNTIDGASPLGKLAFAGGTLYGTTSAGGLSAYGVVFSLQLVSSGPPVIVDQPQDQTIAAGESALFTVSAAGSPPLAYQWSCGASIIAGASTSSLQLTNVQFGQAGFYRVVVTNGFGATTSAPALLTVFGQPTYTVLHPFNGSDGNYPSGSLALSAGTLYGTTLIGGQAGRGTVFEVGTNGIGFSVLKNFSTDNEESPMGGVIVASGRLYGGTWGGGTPATCGAVFALSCNGSGYSVLHSFSGADGRAPSGGLLASGTTLFGTTYQGGAADYGTVFKINPDGSAFTVLKAFTRNDGAYPQAALVCSGTTLYGMAANGGSAGAGVLFRMNADGSGYTILRDFSGTDGSWPSGSLVLCDTTLYGTTRYGGAGVGSIFAINVDGTDFRVLKTFSSADAGVDPCGGLVLAGTRLYGTLAQGGDSVFGAVYKINTDGSQYLVLKRFSGGSDGAYPYGALVFTGSTLYGTAQEGGISGCGVVFSLSLPVPSILAPPGSQTAELGSTVLFRVRTAADPSLTYQWFFNGTNAATEATTNSALALTEVGFSQAGAYSVVVSNDFGVVTSTPAMLNVIAPVERRPVPGVKVTGAAGSLLNLDYADFLRPAPNWTTVASVSLTSTSQYWFDLTAPLPPQRFFRAWQPGTPGVLSSLDLHLVPAITLAGAIGHSVRVDGINRFGPIEAWFTLDTVTLTNTSQLYFDISEWRQPQRLYRLVQVP